MLSRSPLAATWHADNDYSSRLMRGDTCLAVTHRLCGRWDAFIEQSVVPHVSKSTRTTLAGNDTREEAQDRAQAFIENYRNPDLSFARSDAAALGREAIASTPQQDEWSGFQTFAGY
jgi:hypothetical protein